MTSESQKVINVIRQAIDQQTGDQVKRTPGVIRSTQGAQTTWKGVGLLMARQFNTATAGQSASAYIRTDELIEDVIIPSGVFVQTGDYAIIATDQEGKSWIDRALPYSLYDKAVLDNSRGRIGIGDGSTSEYDFGTGGQTLVSAGDAASAYWQTPPWVLPDAMAVAFNNHTDAPDPHTVYVLKSSLFGSTVPSTVTPGTSSSAGSSSSAAKADHSHGMGMQQAYGCRVYRGSAQSIGDNSDTTINFTAETFDDDAMHDTSTNTSNIILKRAGRWLVMAQVSYEADAAGTRAAYLLINGSAVARTRVGASAAQAHRVQVMTIVSVSDTTSILTCQASQNSGGSLDTGSGADETWMSAMWMGE